MNKTEVAWAAGFFEGEGSVSLDKRKSGDFIRLSVSQHHNPYTLHRFHAAVSGGRMYGPYVYPTGNKWAWNCTKTQDVIDIMATLDPYLSAGCVKRVKYRELAEHTTRTY